MEGRAKKSRWEEELNMGGGGGGSGVLPQLLLITKRFI